MSKRSSTPPKPAAERISLAVQYHRRAESAAHQMALWAALCGLELKALKREVNHGDWTEFYEANLADRLPIRTAQNYMRVAEGVKVKNENAFVFGLLEIAPSALDDSQRAELAAAVESIADGETMASLIKAYRISKREPGSTSTGGYRVDEERVQVFLRGYHPELEGTRYADLAADIQAEFRMWFANGDTDQMQLSLDFWQPIFTQVESDDARKTFANLPDSEKARVRASALRIIAWCDGQD